MHGFGKGLNQGSICPEARVHPRLSPDPHRRLEAFFFPFFLLEEAMIGGIKDSGRWWLGSASGIYQGGKGLTPFGIENDHLMDVNDIISSSLINPNHSHGKIPTHPPLRQLCGC